MNCPRSVSEVRQVLPDDFAADTPSGFYPLRLVLGPDGATVELTRPDMLLGRHTDADVRLPTPDVSRRHCRFVFTEGAWEVYDLNSLNGLYVNGARVRQSTLQHHDLVAVGGFRLQVDLSGDPETPADRVLQSIADALPAPEFGWRVS